nr:26S proteasome regulatory subunit S10B homolog B-like [Tanacetum cinerariifolium]
MTTKDEDTARRKAIAEYLEKKRQHELLSLQVRGVREALRSKKKDYAKTKDDLKSLKSVGQSSGEVPRPQGNKPCGAETQGGEETERGKEASVKCSNADFRKD